VLLINQPLQLSRECSACLISPVNIMTCACMSLQVSAMQEEMEKMKEENRMLRRVVDRTMRDYDELKKKVEACYQQQQADEPKVIIEE
jgi:hypothetical protein